MRHPWANVALLLLLAAQLITGFLGFINGRSESRWLLWLHGIGAYATAILLLWKGAIVLDVYQRGRPLSGRRIAFAAMAVLLILTLLSGLIWTFNGPQYLLGFSLVTLHIFLAVALISLAAWHAWHFRWIAGLRPATDRRAFLRTSAVSLAGLSAWWSARLARAVLHLPGADRRFTGSYEQGSYTGRFPVVSWIADYPPPIDPRTWRLAITGAVARPQSVSYEELLALVDSEVAAVLDCTGGWYSNQIWTGIGLDRLLALAEPLPEARSVTVRAVSGYERRFGLGETEHFVLATAVAGAILSHGHGFPARLVAPGERGVNWVKWVGELRVNPTHALWQLPLPLQ